MNCTIGIIKNSWICVWYISVSFLIGIHPAPNSLRAIFVALCHFCRWATHFVFECKDRAAFLDFTIIMSILCGVTRSVRASVASECTESASGVTEASVAFEFTEVAGLVGTLVRRSDLEWATILYKNQMEWKYTLQKFLNQTLSRATMCFGTYHKVPHLN